MNKKFEYAIIIAIFALLAWSVIAPAQASNCIATLNINDSYTYHVCETEEDIDIDITDVGEITIKGQETGAFVDNQSTYNAGYKQGDKDLVNYIKSASGGLKPSKLVKKYHEQTAQISSLSADLSQTKASLEVEKAFSACLISAAGNNGGSLPLNLIQDCADE